MTRTSRLPLVFLVLNTALMTLLLRYQVIGQLRSLCRDFGQADTHMIRLELEQVVYACVPISAGALKSSRDAVIRLTYLANHDVEQDARSYLPPLPTPPLTAETAVPFLENDEETGPLIVVL